MIFKFLCIFGFLEWYLFCFLFFLYFNILILCYHNAKHKNRPWWPIGLRGYLKFKLRECLRSQVPISLGITILIAQSQKWLVTNQQAQTTNEC